MGSEYFSGPIFFCSYDNLHGLCHLFGYLLHAFDRGMTCHLVYLLKLNTLHTIMLTDSLDRCIDVSAKAIVQQEINI